MNRKHVALLIGLFTLAVVGISIWLTWWYFTGHESSVNGGIEAGQQGDDYVLAGISLGMKAQDVRKRLGPPKSISRLAEPSMHNSDYTSYWETWRYRGLSIIFIANEEKEKPKPADPGVVAAVSATSKAYEGPRGLRVGTPLAKALRVFQTSGPDADGIYWSDAGEGSYVSFQAKGGKVSELTVGYSFD